MASHLALSSNENKSSIMIQDPQKNTDWEVEKQDLNVSSSQLLRKILSKLVYIFSPEPTQKHFKLTWCFASMALKIAGKVYSLAKGSPWYPDD